MESLSRLLCFISGDKPLLWSSGRVIAAVGLPGVKPRALAGLRNKVRFYGFSLDILLF